MTSFRGKIFAALASLAVTAAILVSQGMLLENAPHPGALNRVVQQLDTATDGILKGTSAARTGQS
jgi:hypothetical protein